MDFKYVPEVVLLLGCMQRKAVELRLITLSPRPDALVNPSLHRVLQVKGSQLGMILPPREHKMIYRGIFNCYNCRGGAGDVPLGSNGYRPEMLLNIL